MKTTKKLRFTDMPRECAALCRMHLPRPIHDKAEYESALEIAEAFAGFEEKMTTDQTDCFDLICALLETWEASLIRIPKESNRENQG